MAYSFVRENAAGTASPYTITGAANGNILVLGFADFRSPAARTISSLSTTNVTWSKLGGTTNGTMDAEIWLGVVSGGTSGTSITVTMSGTGATLVMRAYEFGTPVGTGTPAADGTFTTNTGTSVTPALGTFTPTESSNLKVGVAGWANGTTPSASPGGVWTAGTFTANSTVVGVQFIYDLIGSASSDSGSWTITSAAWVTVSGAITVPLPPGTWKSEYPDQIFDRVGVVSY